MLLLCENEILISSYVSCLLVSLAFAVLIHPTVFPASQSRSYLGALADTTTTSSAIKYMWSNGQSVAGPGGKKAAFGHLSLTRTLQVNRASSSDTQDFSHPVLGKIPIATLKLTMWFANLYPDCPCKTGR